MLIHLGTCVLLATNVAILTVLAGHQLVAAQNDDQVVPNIFGQIDARGHNRQDSDWFAIKSKQVNRIIQQKESQNPEWLVEEYFSLKSGISYSVHTNLKSEKESYILLAHSGRVYFAAKKASDGSTSCKLDHRLDHSTLFPWRHSSRQVQADGKTVVPRVILGVGALWLNAIVTNAKCTILNNLLECKSKFTNHQVESKLSFATESDNKQLRSARVTRMQSIHLSYDINLVQDMLVDVEVQSVVVLANLDEQTLSKVNKLFDLCEKAVGNMDTLFPSLMRSVAESNKRNYYLSYMVRSIQLDRFEYFSVHEWFSYELQQQTILKQDTANYDAEKYYSQFRYKRGAIASSKQATACFKTSPNDQCHLVDQIYDPLGGLSQMSRRYLDLITRTGDGRSRRTSAQLVGLGALLMNAADFQNKREFADDLMKNNKYLTNIEWIVEDRLEALRIHFYFRKKPYAEHNDCQVSDLIAVEFWELIEKKGDQLNDEQTTSELGSLNGEQNPAGRYLKRLKLKLELVEFSTLLYQDELDRAFKLPKFCEEAQKQVDLVEEHDEGDATTTTPQDVDSKSGRPNPANNEQEHLQESYEFPELEQYLNLERDYIINSEWSYDNGTLIRLIEHLMLDDNQESEDRRLFSRLDVSRHSGLQQFEMYKAYLRYATNTGLRVDQAGCRQVFQVEDFLELLTGYPIEHYGIDVEPELNANKQQFKVYGLGALWKLASQSPFVEYLGQNEDPEADKISYAEWRLADDPSLPDISIVFRFKANGNLASHYKLWQRMTLVKVQIDVGQLDTFKPVNSISINKIELKTGEANALHFILPPSCDPNLDKHYLWPLPKFPTFAETFHSSPKMASFSLSYNLMLSSDEISRSNPLQVLEVNKGPTGLGQVVLDGNGQNSIFWLLTSSDRTLMQHSSIGTPCKELKGDLARFFDIKLVEQLISGGNEGIIAESSNFLIANLWHLLSKRVEFEANLDTAPIGLQVVGRRRYFRGKLDRHVRLIEWSLSNGSQASVKFLFEHSHVGNKLSLFSVMLVSGKLQMRIVMDHIGNVASFETHESAGLPAECYSQISSRAPGDNFPKLSALIESKESLINLSDHPPYLHTRSSLTSSKMGDEEVRYILLDEYLMRGNKMNKYRIKSSSLEENFDYLIYEETRELFDLSWQNHCCVEPPFSSESETLGKPVDWIGENLIAISLDGTAFYGLLNLWRIADLPEHKRVQIGKEQIDISTVFDQAKLRDWFLTEQWQVEAKLSNGVQLSYSIWFDQELDEVSKQWHTVLKRMEVDDRQRKVTVDAIDYGRMFGQGFPRELNIPKGFGCTRNKLFKAQEHSTDATALESLSPVGFDYEASLELVDQESGQFKAQPVFHSGWFGKCPKYWNTVPIGPLRVIYQRRHFVNGTKTSHRQVITCDEQAGTSKGSLINHIRLLDEQTGTCLVRAQVSELHELFGLDFSNAGDDKDAAEATISPIKITDAALGLLTSRMSNFELIQFYEINRIGTAVYELRMDNYELSPNLQGPVSIIRTFERKQNAKSYGQSYFHSDVKIEALILGKARLTLNVKNLGFIECSDILRRAGPEDCYQSSNFEMLSNQALPFHRPPARLRNFLMRFQVTANNSGVFDEKQFEALKPRLERTFVETLLKLPSDLHSMQIGQVHLGYNPKAPRIIQARFNLLEAPSSIEYFVETFAKDLSDSSVNTLGAIKLLNWKESCSNWCDSIGCVALSYCKSRRTCQVITVNMIQSRGFQITDDNLLRYLEDNLREDDDCVYYYAPGGLRRDSLKEITELIKSQLDDNQEESKLEFAFYIGPTSSERVQFKADQFEEVTGDIELLTDEDYSRGCELSSPDPVASHATFATLKVDSSIRYEELQSMKNPDTKLSYTGSQTECQEKCPDCQLVSFCNHVCITTNRITDWSTFKQVVDMAKPDKGCHIQCEDYLLDYHEFTDTSTPSSFAASKQNLSLLECAAMCDFKTGTSDCLSFDFCIDPKRQTATCYLQTVHVMMDDFDGKILAHKKHDGEGGEPNESEERCSHYSKSLLSDFKQLPSKRFARHQSVVFKGTQLDTCALICRRDETCSAFEHCYFAQETTPNSCYIERVLGQLDEAGFGIELGDVEEAEQTLEDQQECSVYRVKHMEEEFRIITDQSSKKALKTIVAIEPNWSHSANRLRWFISGIVLIGCLFGAMVLGAIAQIMFIISTGKQIPVYIA